jgi:methylthioribose-1-phosphate isomerase
VYCSETRPYLQGARLTALSAQQIGHSVTVITDGMGAFLMREGKIGAFVTAADRVCMDGTICNKIGTYANALARARTDCLLRAAAERAGPRERRRVGHSRRVPQSRVGAGIRRHPHRAPGVSALYPAFDITPPDLVTAIVTDRGVARRHLRDYAARIAGAD